MKYEFLSRFGHEIDGSRVYRLKVTGLETLPLFRPDALVFFRAKAEVSTRAIHFIAAHKSS